MVRFTKRTCREALVFIDSDIGRRGYGEFPLPLPKGRGVIMRGAAHPAPAKG